MTVSWYGRYRRNRGKDRNGGNKRGKESCWREVEADTDRGKMRWWCDSRRKGLCWRVALSTKLFLVWLEKAQDGQNCAEVHTPKKKKKGLMKEALLGEGNSQVWSVLSVCMIRLSTALTLPVLCLFGPCLSGSGVWQRQQQTRATQTYAYNLKRWFGLLNVARAACVNENVFFNRTPQAIKSKLKLQNTKLRLWQSGWKLLHRWTLRPVV